MRWSSETRPANNLLNVLQPSELALLAKHLQPWHGDEGALLYNAGDNVDMVYFPCGPSLVSYLVPQLDGREIETILVGREGAVGGIVSSGRLPAYTRIAVKHSGPFVKMAVYRLEELKSQSPPLRYLFARYADCLLAQVFQSTACNALHSIEQRLAKWIIAAMDRTGDHVVPLTHEQLASVLGVGRSYASRVMRTLKEEGILQTQRGSVIVRDRDLLHARACRCNESVRKHFDTVLQGVYPTIEESDREAS